MPPETHSFYDSFGSSVAMCVTNPKPKHTQTRTPEPENRDPQLTFLHLPLSRTRNPKTETRILKPECRCVRYDLGRVCYLAQDFKPLEVRNHVVAPEPLSLNPTPCTPHSNR